MRNHRLFFLNKLKYFLPSKPFFIFAQETDKLLSAI